MQTIEISFNGEPMKVDGDARLSALLARDGFDPQYVAVVVNEELVPVSDHLDRALQAGDRVEILMPFAGG